VRRCDAQRIEHAAQRRVRAQRQRLDVGSDVVEQMEAVVALGIAVDDSCALQEPLVLELLGKGRLPRPERPDAEDRRVAVAVGSLAQVEAHRSTRSRERVPKVKPAARSGHVRRGRHHRGELLGGECVLEARHACPLRRQVLHEQGQLIPQRPV